MFTGIIEATAAVQKTSKTGLVLLRPAIFDDLKTGCSIAVSGTCLSVTSFDASSMSFDVVPTTLAKTKLGSLKVGGTVNLERAMKADARFEGHIVQGHVDGTGEVIAVSNVPPPPTPSPHPQPLPRDGAGENERDPVYRAIGSLTYPPLSVVRNAQKMRKVPTPAEKKLWNALRAKKIDGLYFRRQRPIGPFIVDFFCEEKKLAVEVDGGYHNNPHIQEDEKWRESELDLRGVFLLRFTNEQVLKKLDTVLERIRSFEPKSSPPPSRGRGSRGGGMGSERGVRGEGLREGARDGLDRLLTIRVPNYILSSIVPHGSITIDGVALTVADLKKSEVTVALIPQTLAVTTLGNLKPGDPVNIETDILGKYILAAHGRH